MGCRRAGYECRPTGCCESGRPGYHRFTSAHGMINTVMSKKIVAVTGREIRVHAGAGPGRFRRGTIPCQEPIGVPLFRIPACISGLNCLTSSALITPEGEGTMVLLNTCTVATA